MMSEICDLCANEIESFNLDTSFFPPEISEAQKIDGTFSLIEAAKRGRDAFVRRIKEMNVVLSPGNQAENLSPASEAMHQFALYETIAKYLPHFHREHSVSEDGAIE